MSDEPQLQTEEWSSCKVICCWMRYRTSSSWRAVAPSQVMLRELFQLKMEIENSCVRSLSGRIYRQFRWVFAAVLFAVPPDLIVTTVSLGAAESSTPSIEILGGLLTVLTRS
jgi:hypothetical protein